MRSLAAHLLAISFPLLLMSGMTAYIISSWVLVFVRAIGATEYAPRLYWACGLFGSTRGAALIAGRLARAFALTLLIPFWYAIVFGLVGNADLRIGTLLGLAHGGLVGFTLPLATRRSGCAKTPAPGLFAWRLGFGTPLLLLLVYAVYGAILGYAYVVVAP
jgi:hypothetical protein